MQSFSNEAWTGANNASVSEPLRYMAQRLPELLDPHAHFGRSASFRLDPVTALREIIDLASAFATTDARNPSAEVLVDALQNVRTVLLADPHLANWFRAERESAVSALRQCTDFAAARKRKLGPRDWLQQELPNAARGPLRSLRQVLEDASDGYRARLLAHVKLQMQEGLPIAPDWRSFDLDLQNLAAIFLAEGRSGSELGASIARSIARADDTPHALEALDQAWNADKTDFVVAFCLPGVRRPRNLAAFGCRKVVNSAATWHPKRSHPADRRLKAFAEDHGCVILTDVSAFDFEQAQTIAFDAAERLADQYGARHRTYSLDVSPKMLLLRSQDHRTSLVDPSPRRQPTPRALLPAPNEALEQSFRYAALARSERSPIVRILHSWIALEALASEPTSPKRPYPFLQSRLAPLLSLQAVRHGLALSWQVASRAGRRGSNRDRWSEVERWLGIKTKGRTLNDLNDWVALLKGPASRKAPKSLPEDASSRDAAAVFNELLEDFPPFPRKTVEHWRWMLTRGPRLANWCAAMEQQAHATINRMYVVRNFSVHKALTKSDGAGQLAQAAHNVVDVVYEVLPAWLQPNKPTWKSLDGLRRRAYHVRRTWGRNKRPALINAEKLTRPGGDGLR